MLTGYLEKLLRTCDVILYMIHILYIFIFGWMLYMIWYSLCLDLIINVFVCFTCRSMEVLSRSQTDFEKLRLDMEMEIRELKHRLDNEVQSRISAEGLVSQLKGQMKKGEDKMSGYDHLIILIIFVQL